MKKFFKTLFINLIIFVFLLGLIELFCIFNTFQEIKQNGYTFSKHLKNTIESYKNDKYINIKDIRPISIPRTKVNKQPLAVMGCSYAYGLHLRNEETLSAKLSELTNRTVINLGINGASPREILYIFSNENIFKQLFKNELDIEYVFYPYISHHRFRLYNQTVTFSSSPCFRKVNNKLEFYEQNKLIRSSQLYKKFMELKYYTIKRKESLDLMFLYLKEINKEMKKRLPNATFVLLLYEDYLNEDWSELEKDGIIVINIEKLANIHTKDPQYTQSETDPHPNAKAWEIITPALVKELNL